MRIDCLSIFPELVRQALAHSIPGKAQERELVDIRHHDIRDFTEDKHHRVDDIPYGGGAGMVFKPEPVAAAIRSVRHEDSIVVHPSPAAPSLTQKDINELATHDHLIFLASRYEGLDQRITDRFVDREYAVGDFVFSGGELACAIMIDAVLRLIPGVLGKEESYREDSFFNGLLDFPHYTRPAEFERDHVPEVLRGGNHEEIRRWRKRQALERTLRHRPDLLTAAELDREAEHMLDQIRAYRDEEG